jgi:hypothetical protein
VSILYLIDLFLFFLDIDPRRPTFFGSHYGVVGDEGSIPCHHASLPLGHHARHDLFLFDCRLLTFPKSSLGNICLFTLVATTKIIGHAGRAHVCNLHYRNSVGTLTGKQTHTTLQAFCWKGGQEDLEE